MNRAVILLCLMGFLTVALGAFGAHALKDSLDARSLSLWQTAIQYLMFHTASGIGFVAICASRRHGAIIRLIDGFALGALFFCGSLFALALGAPRLTGLVTPIGGTIWLISWLYAAFTLSKKFYETPND